MSEPPDSAAFERYRDTVERPISRILSRFGRARVHWLGLGLFFSLLEHLIVLLPPYVLGVAIDAVFRDDAAFAIPLVPAAALPESQQGQLEFAIAVIAGSYVLVTVIRIFRGLSLDYFSHRLMHEVRTATYEKLQRLELRFFDDHETGDLMSILNNDVSNFELFFDDALQNIVRICAVVLGTAAMLFWLNWQLALVTMVAVPLLAVMTLWFMNRIEPVYDAIRASIGSLNTRFENNLGGIELVKTSTTEPYENERVADSSWQYFTTNWKRIKLELTYHPVVALVSNLSFVLTFAVGGYWLVAGPPGPFTGELTAGTLVTFLFLSQRFSGPMRRIGTVIDQYANARASGKRVCGLLDIPTRITDDPEAAPLEDVDGRVVYDDVTFGYEEGDPVLEELSFEAEPGETVAFVGPTGAGKSTALKLLSRLYDVDDGSIRVDGRDVRDVRLADLRGAIGVVSQSPFLFGGTIEENIAYGAFDVSHDEVVEAAKAAEAHEFIASLPNGYDTQVGERGVKLSGGQRQRISIARTVVNDPPILVFDEATSAVDTETELLIQRSLDRLAADRTTFVIAHRLSTVKDADEILVLEDGRIVDRGTHEELLAHDGLYANLWRVQIGELGDLPEEFVERSIERVDVDR